MQRTGASSDVLAVAVIATGAILATVAGAIWAPDNIAGVMVGMFGFATATIATILTRTAVGRNQRGISALQETMEQVAPDALADAKQRSHYDGYVAGFKAGREHERFAAKPAPPHGTPPGGGGSRKRSAESSSSEQTANGAAYEGLGTYPGAQPSAWSD